MHRMYAQSYLQTCVISLVVISIVCSSSTLSSSVGRFRCRSWRVASSCTGKNMWSMSYFSSQYQHKTQLFSFWEKKKKVTYGPCKQGNIAAETLFPGMFLGQTNEWETMFSSLGYPGNTSLERNVCTCSI